MITIAIITICVTQFPGVLLLLFLLFTIATKMIPVPIIDTTITIDIVAIAAGDADDGEKGDNG